MVVNPVECSKDPAKFQDIIVNNHGVMRKDGKEIVFTTEKKRVSQDVKTKRNLISKFFHSIASSWTAIFSDYSLLKIAKHLNETELNKYSQEDKEFLANKIDHFKKRHPVLSYFNKKSINDFESRLSTDSGKKISTSQNTTTNSTKSPIPNPSSTTTNPLNSLDLPINRFKEAFKKQKEILIQDTTTPLLTAPNSEKDLDKVIAILEKAPDLNENSLDSLKEEIKDLNLNTYSKYVCYVFLSNFADSLESESEKLKALKARLFDVIPYSTFNDEEFIDNSYFLNDQKNETEKRYLRLDLIALSNHHWPQEYYAIANTLDEQKITQLEALSQNIFDSVFKKARDFFKPQPSAKIFED